MKFLKNFFKEIKEAGIERMEERLMWIDSEFFWFFMDWIAPILSALVVSLLVNYFLRK